MCKAYLYVYTPLDVADAASALVCSRRVHTRFLIAAVHAGLLIAIMCVITHAHTLTHTHTHSLTHTHTHTHTHTRPHASPSDLIMPH
jgi:hypothetical protein